MRTGGTNSGDAVAGIILAAGESRRFGSPKALAVWKGKTFAAAIVDAMRAGRLEPRILVLGHKAAEVRAALGPIDARVVVNDQYPKGQFSSVQVGIRAVAGECQAAVIALVDQPHVPAAFFRRLREELNAGTRAIIVPRVAGKRAHPVGVGSRWFDEILNMDASLSLRDFFAAHAGEIFYLETDQSSLLLDVDTPEDLQRLEQMARYGRPSSARS